MRNKLLSGILAASLLGMSVLAVNINNIEITEDNWIISGTTEELVSQVVMQIISPDATENGAGVNSSLPLYGLSDIRQTFVGEDNSFSFSIPRKTDYGKYLIRARDSADVSYAQKAVFAADGATDDIMYTQDFSGNADEWWPSKDAAGTGSVISTGKYRMVANPGTFTAYIKGFDHLGNYRYSCDLQCLTSKMQSKILFNYKDEKNYYYFDLSPVSNSGSGKLLFGAVQSGVTYFNRIISQGAFPSDLLKTGAYKIVIEIKGFQIQAFMDNRLVLTAYDESIQNSGTVGVSITNGQAYLDNVSVANVKDDINLGKTYFENENTIALDALPKTGSVTAKIPAGNSSDQPFSADMIVALYDNNRLTDVQIKPEVLQPKESRTLQAYISIPENKNVTHLQAFLWKTDGSLAPLETSATLYNEVKTTKDVYYVAETGNDTNGDGSLVNPYATLEKALAAAKGCENNNGITIYMRGGRYKVSNTISINGSDYSTAQNQPLIICAYPNEKAVLTGSSEIDFSKAALVTDESILQRMPAEASGNVYSIDLAAQGLSGMGELGIIDYVSGISKYIQLYQNSNKMTRARYPNTGYIQTGTPYYTGTSTAVNYNEVTYDNLRANYSNISFQVSDSRIQRWQTADAAHMGGFWCADWCYESTRLLGVDNSNGGLVVEHPNHFGIISGQNFFAYNLMEEIDMPGEWFVDKNTNILYFYPLAPLSETTSMTIGTLDQEIINLTDCDNVVLKNLVIEGGNVSGIEAVQSNHVRLENLEVANLGTSGIVLSGCSNAIVKGCRVHNTGMTGIALMSSGNSVTLDQGMSQIINNTIHDFSNVVKVYSPGISINQGSGNIISHNKIYNGPHSGIIVSGCAQTIQYNEIANVLQESADAGAIYCGRSYIQRGIKIDSNFIHDLYDSRNNGNNVVGVYLDDLMSGVSVTNNIFYRLPSGIFLNGGRDNILKNNIIAEVTGSQPVKPYSIWARNVGTAAHYQSILSKMLADISTIDLTSTAWSKYPNVAKCLSDSPGAALYNTIEDNVIANHYEMLLTDQYTSYSPMGENLTYTGDIGFTDEQKGNLTLRGDSVVFMTLPDFNAIEFDKIGLSKNGGGD